MISRFAVAEVINVGPLERWLRRAVNPISTGLTVWWLGGGRRKVPVTLAPESEPNRPGSRAFIGVASPGDWIVPAGQRPGWDWLPEHGAAPNLRAMPRWVRVWYRTPLIDRYAYQWMWWHGGWAVLVPRIPPSPPDNGVRAP